MTDGSNVRDGRCVDPAHELGPDGACLGPAAPRRCLTCGAPLAPELVASGWKRHPFCVVDDVRRYL